MFKKFAVCLTVFALLVGTVFAKGGGSSYSAGSKPSTPSYSAGSKPSTPSYSAGSKPSTPSYSGGNSSPSSPSKPGGGFLSSQSRAQSQVESGARFKAATTPAEKISVVKESPAFKDNTVKNTITHERYVTYETRSRGFYGGYYGRPMDPYYNTFSANPCYNMFFWMWLMEKANDNERTAWAYNHRSNLSDSEWQALCKKDAQLEARVKQLEGKGAAADPNYVPAEMKDNPDLMYNAHFVQAAAEENSGPGVGTVLLWIFGTLAVVAIIGGGIYFFCVREY